MWRFRLTNQISHCRRYLRQFPFQDNLIISIPPIFTPPIHTSGLSFITSLVLNIHIIYSGEECESCSDDLHIPPFISSLRDASQVLLLPFFTPLLIVVAVIVVLLLLLLLWALFFTSGVFLFLFFVLYVCVVVIAWWSGVRSSIPYSNKCCWISVKV